MWNFVDFGENHFVQEPIEIDGDRQFLGRSFYSCNYVCPKCKTHLLKSNIKAEYKGEVTINTNEGERPFSSVFYCNVCKELYTTGSLGGFNGGMIQKPDGSFIPMNDGGKTLAEGKVFVLSDPQELAKTIKAIDDNYGAESNGGVKWI